MILEPGAMQLPKALGLRLSSPVLGKKVPSHPRLFAYYLCSAYRPCLQQLGEASWGEVDLEADSR